MTILRSRIPYPPTLSNDSSRLEDDLQALSNWFRQLWTDYTVQPRVSWFSGVSPNLSQITGFQGDLAINVASASTNTVLWVLAGVGSASTTSSWRAVQTIALS